MTQEQSYERSHAFLTALFEATTSFLQALPPGRLPTTTPMKFRRSMTLGQEYNKQGPTRLKFYTKVVDRATVVSECRPLSIIH
jgi:hypothetical protein